MKVVVRRRHDYDVGTITDHPTFIEMEDSGALAELEKLVTRKRKKPSNDSSENESEDPPLRIIRCPTWMFPMHIFQLFPTKS